MVSVMVSSNLINLILIYNNDLYVLFSSGAAWHDDSIHLQWDLITKLPGAGKMPHQVTLSPLIQIPKFILLWTG